MAQERLANIGYFALIKEATKGTPLNPSSGDFIPLYKETMSTQLQLVDDNPIVGTKFKRYQVLPGQRRHTGDATIMAEGNTIARVLDMLLTKGTTTGANPYTHPFTLSVATNPNSYTVDISTGNVVSRYWGVEASKFEQKYDKNKMMAVVAMSALGSFQGRQIATVATTTLTLDTVYDTVPNKGLVVGDTVRIYKAATGATLDTTIATVNVDGITVTLAASAAAFAAGDMIYLRPATPAFNNLQPFLWSNTEFRFGATASAALSATQTRVEQGSEWSAMHDFEDDGGSERSGGLDPASLPRTQGDVSLKVKKFFDTPEDLQNFNQLTKTSCVVRHFAGATRQYELRVTYNHIKTDGKPVGDLDSGTIIYSELDFKPQHDLTDGQAFDIKVLNALSTI